MRTLFALIIALSMAIGIVACGNEPETQVSAEVQPDSLAVDSLYVIASDTVHVQPFFFTLDPAGKEATRYGMTAMLPFTRNRDVTIVGYDLAPQDGKLDHIDMMDGSGMAQILFSKEINPSGSPDSLAVEDIRSIFEGLAKGQSLNGTPDKIDNTFDVERIVAPEQLARFIREHRVEQIRRNNPQPDQG